jgi:hypothetical protein
MGIFSGPGGSSTPNDKQYELRYLDGDKFRLDNGGQALKTFSLAIAIQVADHEAGRGVHLCVVDPETDTVLWIGERAMR